MSGPIALGAVAAVLVYLLWALHKYRGQRGSPALVALLICSLLLELPSLFSMARPEEFARWQQYLMLLESLLPAVWFWFSLTYGRPKLLRDLPLHLRLSPFISVPLSLAILVTPVSGLFYAPSFPREQVLFLEEKGVVFYLVILVCLVIALFNLEQTLLQTPPEQRHRIRPGLLGAGALLVVQVIYYSQALVFHTLNLQLATTRAVLLAAAVILFARSSWQRNEAVKLRMSQQLAYRSLVLVVVGIYITGLAAARQGMKYFGTPFQQALLMAALLLAGLGLLLLLFSEKARRRARLYIHRNFYGAKYDYRMQWLCFTDRLSSAVEKEALKHQIVVAFCEIFGMERGVLLLLDQQQQCYRYGAGSPTQDNDFMVSRHDPLICRLANKIQMLDLRDEPHLLHQEGWYGLSEPSAFRFIIPLAVQRELEGFILLGRPHAAEEQYDVEDYDLMGTLACQASAVLLNLRLTEQLARTREMAALGKVSAFVMHDLKNLVSALSLSLENARQYMADPAFQQELLSSVSACVGRMQGLITRLRCLPDQEQMQRASVNLLQVALDTAALVKGADLQVTGKPVMAYGDRDELQKVAMNLMINAVEASNGVQPVTVEVGERDYPFFKVKDRGCGIPERFLKSILVTPFFSTKEQGMGIGLYQSRQIVEAHGGSIEVNSSVNQGSEFTVWLPRIDSEAACRKGGYGKIAHC